MEALSEGSFKSLIREALVDLGLKNGQLDSATDFALAHLHLFHDLAESMIEEDELELILNHVRSNIVQLRDVANLTKKRFLHVSEN